MTALHDDINQQASVFMKKGIAFLETGTAADLPAAIHSFDAAIALRRGLPLEANPHFRYGLAAGWINRADALARLGSLENNAEALRSYEAALETMRDLPLDENPLFRRRLAIAWQNRGLLLQKQGEAASLLEAGRSFEAAMAALLEGNAAEISDREYLLATVRMNFANALVRENALASSLRARVMAQEALALAQPFATLDLAMADVSLKARHILCRTLTDLLRDDQAPLSQTELIGDATDAAEEGLVVARAWEERGIHQFRSVAHDLFQFCARVYRIFQPHFFNEFLLEHIHPWPESPESRAK